MGTNENEKFNEEIENINEIQNAETVENTEKANDNVIDMQATQRIVLLDEFFQHEGKKISEENNIEISKKIESFESENFTKLDAQTEPTSQSEQNTQTAQNEEISNEINKEISEEISKELSNEIEENNEEISNEISEEINGEINEPVNEVDIIIDDNTENKDVAKEETQIENNENVQRPEENKAEDQDEKKIVMVETDKPAEQVAEEVPELTEEEKQIRQEKIKIQHAQDKKDYRLEIMLFDRINTMQGSIKESLELIKKFERINAKDENLPNIVTTLHDKLTHEVIKQFRTVGIEFNMKSFLVQSVVSDLLGKFEKGITEFKDCSENLNFVREVQEDFESRVQLALTSKGKNIFAKIRGIFFKPERKQEILNELERERQENKLQEANIHLKEYKDINAELEKYTIKNNIVNSLSNEILYGQSSGLTNNINEFIDKRIVSEMKKLGLESSINELKDTLFNEYKEKDESITNEDFWQMQLGTLKKNMKLQKADLMRSKITQTVNVANRVEKEDDEREAI